MDKIIIIYLVLCAISPVISKITIYDVTNYGAIGDGKNDDSQAFLNAWEAVCQAPYTPTLVIPKRKTFLLKPLTFNGPCNNSRIYFLVSGTIVAPNSQSGYSGYAINSWLIFSNVNGLNIVGKGTIDGQGSAWWPKPCLDNAPDEAKCKGPTALNLRRCNGLRIEGLTHINSSGSHIIVTASSGVRISNLRIIAPGDSPNTDGIDISSCKDVRISNSIIATGDDCIAIGGGSSNINITGVTCGPGHGISIGALGHGGYDIVEDIHVRNCTLKDTTNGVRIKSWQGGNGYARKISFEAIKFEAVDNPIIIDQFYCPSRVNCQNYTSAIALSDISYIGIVGTSITDRVIDLSCSESVGCENIVLDRVYLKTPGKKAYARCLNVHGRLTHVKPSMDNCL